MKLTRETTRCGVCELRQFMTDSGKCRRCKANLRRGSVETCKVLILAVPDTTLYPMREMERRAVQTAMEQTGGVMRAAAALGISAKRVKRLLRESGNNVDHRCNRKARKEGRA